MSEGSPTVDHVYVYVRITNRQDEVVAEEQYAGSMPDWAWSDPGHVRDWKRSKRAQVLADLTADPRGWTVRFSSRTEPL